MSRGLTVLVLMVCVIVNTAFALFMFGTGWWPVGLLNAGSAAFSLYVLIQMVDW